MNAWWWSAPPPSYPGMYLGPYPVCPGSLVSLDVSFASQRVWLLHWLGRLRVSGLVVYLDVQGSLVGQKNLPSLPQVLLARPPAATQTLEMAQALLQQRPGSVMVIDALEEFGHPAKQFARLRQLCRCNASILLWIEGIGRPCYEHADVCHGFDAHMCP